MIIGSVSREVRRLIPIFKHFNLSILRGLSAQKMRLSATLKINSTASKVPNALFREFSSKLIKTILQTFLTLTLKKLET